MITQYARFLVRFLLLSCLTTSAIAATQLLDKIVAIVDNDIITNSELEQHKK